jgi:hypothetical protein
VKSKQTLSDPCSLLDDEKSIPSDSNQSPNNYLKLSEWSNTSHSLIDKKTAHSPRIDKTFKSQDEQNITSSYFASEQTNEPFKHALQYDTIIQSLSNKCTDNPESSPTSQKRYSRSDPNEERVISSYFANEQTLNDKYIQNEQEDNPLEKQSSVSDCQDSQVDEITPKSEKSRELDDDLHCVERCLPIDKDTKNLQNNCVTYPEEDGSKKISSNNSCGEKMTIYFDPSWIKQKSSLSNHSSQSQNQNISTYRSKKYQIQRLSHAVIAEGTKIKQLCMNNVAKDDCDILVSNIDSLCNGNKNREFENNDNVKNCEKAEETDLDHMNVGPFDFKDAIQSMRPCREFNENNNANNLGVGHNVYHKDTMLNGSNCCFQLQQEDIANNQFLHISHCESSDGLMYGVVGEESFAQESTVDNQPFQDSNILTDQPFEDNQHWTSSNIFPICEQNFIAQTSAQKENQFSWFSDNELSNFQHNNELVQANTSSKNMTQSDKQAWGDRINTDNELSNLISQDNTSSDDSQYIIAEPVTAHDYDSLDVEGDCGINMVAFVWKKHRLH